MILRKYMALLGIGSAKIDLILEKETYKPGELVKGYFLIKGGTILQELKRIDCDLVINDGAEENEKIVESITILTTKSIQSEAINKIPFTFPLPNSAQVSTGTLSYRFKTRLAFKKGVESYDQDAIRILVD
ncbi:sporulation protein [Cytobacillus dafuensis]|uniref:Sporulation protein n=1 Tax=Cytobacillus dafuensis TaxID=1742359 RepID=A0A5B8ZBE6_CYTDA|nr:sporulation protein [Cytobacillus dafuensis]QED49573.1 sporulation protein [Cytobacillus dafuensis]